MVQLAEDEDWAAGWVFDGRKNIYAPYQFKSGPTFKFLSQDEQDYEVRHIYRMQWPLNPLINTGVCTCPVSHLVHVRGQQPGNAVQ